LATRLQFLDLGLGTCFHSQGDSLVRQLGAQWWRDLKGRGTEENRDLAVRTGECGRYQAIDTRLKDGSYIKREASLKL
jgi:hypothetical protein